MRIIFTCSLDLVLRMLLGGEHLSNDAEGGGLVDAAPPAYSPEAWGMPRVFVTSSKTHREQE